MLKGWRRVVGRWSSVRRRGSGRPRSCSSRHVARPGLHRPVRASRRVGVPPWRPWERACSRPARVRSRSASRFQSASEARTGTTSLPAGVARSRLRAVTRMPRASRSGTVFNASTVVRPSRSRRVAVSISPGCRYATAAGSPGRSARALEAMSDVAVETCLYVTPSPTSATSSEQKSKGQHDRSKPYAAASPTTDTSSGECSPRRETRRRHHRAPIG